MLIGPYAADLTVSSQDPTNTEANGGGYSSETEEWVSMYGTKPSSAYKNEDNTDTVETSADGREGSRMDVEGAADGAETTTQGEQFYCRM